MIPYNQTEYPKEIESEGDYYYRFYTRPRFIIYEIYNAAQLQVGFLCINSRTQFIIQGKPYHTMWQEMEAWADRNEQDKTLKQIAR